jgi:RND family efflux transporter MFP subunit
MVSIDVLRLELTVPEASITRVATGGTLTFEVPAFPGRTFSGTVRFVGAAVREMTRDLVAEAEVPNPDRALRPGMFAAVSLAAGDAPAPAVPKAALLQKEGSLRVFAVVDHRLEERVVQRGVEKDGFVAVVRGLKAGDKVVAAPTDALQNGQPVE